MENLNIIINFIEENWSAFEFRCAESNEDAEKVLEELKNIDAPHSCSFKRTIEFLQGKAFRFTLRPGGGYQLTMPGLEITPIGAGIVEVVDRVILHEKRKKAGF